MLLRGIKTEGSWREVPMTAQWRPVLERALELTPVREDGKLFEHWTNLLRDIDVAFEKAGVEHCSMNDFRRTFATELVESGMAPHLVGRLLGHTAKSQLVDLVYARKLRREQFAALLNTGKSTPTEPPSPPA
jgi:integrase